jgi:hypothetical protein
MLTPPSWCCRPRTAAGGGRPQGGLEVVRRILTGPTEEGRAVPAYPVQRPP